MHQLRENNAQKDQLFAIIGHDLRSPVASLKNTLTVLKLKNRPVKELDVIENQMNILYTTLDNLLYWFLNQRNGIRVVPRSVDLVDVVQDVLEGLIRFKKLTLITDLKPRAGWMDENLASLVLRNMLHNACEFTPVGGGIAIRTLQEQRTFGHGARHGKRPNSPG